MLRFHKYTALFTRTLFERAVVINDNWQAYSLIQQIESGKFTLPVLHNVPVVKDCYVNFVMVPTNKIGSFMEHNGPTNFYPLVQEGINVHVYKKGEHLDTQCQAEPDDVFNMKNSSYIDKRIHGMDHKAYESIPNESESKIFSQLSVEKYERTLNNLGQAIVFNLELNHEQLATLTHSLAELARTCNDIKTHQKIWASVAHHFPDNFIPPIRIPANFAVENLKPSFLEEYKISQIRMRKISDYLYQQKVPENDYKKAVDLFDDSFIKDLFSAD